MAHVGQKIALCAIRGFSSLFRLLHCSFSGLAVGDVSANTYVLLGQAVFIEKRNNGRTHPIQSPIAGTIADFTPPDLPRGDGVPDIGVEIRGMLTRFDDTMRFPQQLLSGIAADLAKTIIGVNDIALCIGNADNRMLIKRKLLIGQCTPVLFAGRYQCRDTPGKRSKVFAALPQKTLRRKGIRQQIAQRFS